MSISKTLIIFGLFLSVGCTTQQIQEGLSVLTESGGAGGALTNGEIVSGLKQALDKGAEFAGNKLSKQNGFLGNQAIKILFPKEFQKAESTLRKIGMGSLADQAIESFNRAAESASSKAYPILASAVKNMTVTDAMGILTGGSNSATEYLKKQTSSDLQSAFLPIVKKSANEVSATKHWGDIASKYNSIPFTKKVPTDISAYITEKTLNGLFVTVASEEAAIRTNPVKRTTALLQKVFGFSQSKK